MFTKISALLLSVALIGFNRQDLHQPLTDTKLSLEGHTSVAQSFTAGYNNLNIVGICLRNSGRLQTPLEFALYEATVSAAPVRTIDFSSANISGDDCTRLQFQPVADSSGKKYIAVVSATKPEKDFSHYGLYAESFGGKDYIDGEASLDGVPAGSDLHFKTSYRTDLGTTVRESLSQLLTRLAEDLAFFIPYTVLLSAVIYKIRRVKK